MVILISAGVDLGFVLRGEGALEKLGKVISGGEGGTKNGSFFVLTFPPPPVFHFLFRDERFRGDK